MTVPQILEDLKPVKPMSRATLYVYFDKFGIKPVSEVRQIPQQFPDDAALIIRKRLGFSKSSKRAKNGGAR